MKLEEEVINEEVESEKFSPIRISHLENIITSCELNNRIENAGLKLVSWIPFESFWDIFPMKLLKGEMEMSSLCVVAVFERGANTISSARQNNDVANDILFSDRLSQELERDIIIFFDSRSFDLQAFIK